MLALSIYDAKLENGDLSDEQTELILKRRAICEACPLNSSNARTSPEVFGRNAAGRGVVARDFAAVVVVRVVHDGDFPRSDGSASGRCGSKR